MQLTPEQIEVLEDATEDYGYLFWAVGYVRGLYPDTSYEQQKDKARQAVKDMLADGLLSLFCGIAFNGEETEIAPSEWETILADPLQWDWEQYQDKDWTDDETQFRYVATDKGNTVYRDDPQIWAYYRSKFWADHHPGYSWGYYRGQEGSKP